MSERLKRLAERYGIALEYQNARGASVPPDMGVVAKLLKCMGVLPTVDQHEANARRAVLPPVIVAIPENDTVMVRFLDVPAHAEITKMAECPRALRSPKNY